MDFNKIEETIKARNFAIKYVLKNTTKMSPNGFRLALLNKTLKVDHLEQISKAIGVPMQYWWETESELLQYPGVDEKHIMEDHRSIYDKVSDEKINDLIALLKSSDDDKRRLKEQVDELREKLGLGKVGT